MDEEQKKFSFSTGDGYQERSESIPVEVDGKIVGDVQVRFVHDPGDPLPYYSSARFIRSG